MYRHALPLTALLLGASIAPAHAFPSYTDPATGRQIYQLTSGGDCTGGCDDNYGLYYHTNTVDGEYLVYRHLKTGFDVSYNRLNLATGAITPLTTPYACNGDFVSGNTFYCLGQTGSPRTVQKIDILSTTQTPTLCAAESGYILAGSLTVNSTGTHMIFVEFTPNLSSAKYKLCSIADGTTNELNISAAPDDALFHFQFSPTDPNGFTYMHTTHATGLTAIGMGQIVNGRAQGKPLLDPSNTLNYNAFYHPFYGTDGALWSDYGPLIVGGQFHFVKFAFASLGRLSSYKSMAADSTAWPNHTHAARDGGWFVGDGLGNITQLAQPPGSGSFIQQIHLAPDDTGTWGWHSYPLAAAAGTNYTDGNMQANVHYAPSHKWVVWSAFRTLNGAESTMRNIFATETTVTTSRAYPTPSVLGTDWDIKNGEAGYWTWSGYVKTWVSSGGQGLTELVTTPIQFSGALSAGQLWGVAWGNAVQWNGVTWVGRGNPTHLAIDCSNAVWGIDVWGQSVRWNGTSWLGGMGQNFTNLYMDGCTLRGTQAGAQVAWTGTSWTSI